MIGVFCQLVGALASGQIVLSSAGTPDCFQAMDNLATVSLLIWSSGEYFALALSPEYAGQLWTFSSLPVAFHAATMTRTATGHQSLFFMSVIIVTASRLGKELWESIHYWRTGPPRIGTVLAVEKECGGRMTIHLDHTIVPA